MTNELRAREPQTYLLQCSVCNEPLEIRGFIEQLWKNEVRVEISPCTECLSNERQLGRNEVE